jgi:type II secretory pathway pseudopilin PulG
MRRMYPKFLTKPAGKSMSGFTLIEMLVVAPFVILLIGATISIISTLTGDSLKVVSKNEKVYEVQDALEVIEAYSERARQGFETTSTPSPLTSPQGQNSGTSGFSSSASTLVIQIPATTENPFSSSRRILYTDNLCTTVYPVYLVYFLDNGTLYERTVRGGGTSGYSINSSNTCVSSTPWQRGSCKSGDTGTVCLKTDEALATDVTSFAITYPAPTTAKVSLTTSKTVAGDAQTYTSSLIITAPSS